MNDVEKVIDLCTYVAYDLSIIRRTEIGIETGDIDITINGTVYVYNSNLAPVPITIDSAKE
jgi:hypothetical protein